MREPQAYSTAVAVRKTLRAISRRMHHRSARVRFPACLVMATLSHASRKTLIVPMKPPTRASIAHRRAVRRHRVGDRCLCVHRHRASEPTSRRIKRRTIQRADPPFAASGPHQHRVSAGRLPASCRRRPFALKHRAIEPTSRRVERLLPSYGSPRVCGEENREFWRARLAATVRHSARDAWVT